MLIGQLNLQVENEQRAQLPSRQGASPEQTSSLEESIYKLSAQLSTVSRNQKYFRTRENRNFSTVRSTERRIFNFSVIESLMMVSMAALQVFVVRFFFQGARKGMFTCSPYLRVGYKRKSWSCPDCLVAAVYPIWRIRIDILKQVTCDVSMSMNNNMMHFTTFYVWRVGLVIFVEKSMMFLSVWIKNWKYIRYSSWLRVMVAIDRMACQKRAIE